MHCSAVCDQVLHVSTTDHLRRRFDGQPVQSIKTIHRHESALGDREGGHGAAGHANVLSTAQAQQTQQQQNLSYTRIAHLVSTHQQRASAHRELAQQAALGYPDKNQAPIAHQNRLPNSAFQGGEGKQTNQDDERRKPGDEEEEKKAQQPNNSAQQTTPSSSSVSNGHILQSWQRVLAHRDDWVTLRDETMKSLYRVTHWMALDTAQRKELAISLCTELLFSPQEFDTLIETANVTWNTSSYWSNFEIDVLCQRTVTTKQSGMRHVTDYTVHIDDHGRLDSYDVKESEQNAACVVM